MNGREYLDQLRISLAAETIRFSRTLLHVEAKYNANPYY
jgi:hypothetical protein